MRKDLAEVAIPVRVSKPLQHAQVSAEPEFQVFVCENIQFEPNTITNLVLSQSQGLAEKEEHKTNVKQQDHSD